MSSNKRANVNFKNSMAQVSANVALYYFVEEGIHFVYSPHLDITGYGNSEKEASESFNVCLAEFFDYTTKKHTIFDELVALGWKIKKGSLKKPKKVEAPKWADLIKMNSDLEKILSSKHKTQQREVSIPI